jgi:polyferredoxin
MNPQERKALLLGAIVLAVILALITWVPYSVHFFVGLGVVSAVVFGIYCLLMALGELAEAILKRLKG